jgi:hypothetical protein
VAFAKELKDRGIPFDLISQIKTYPPPFKDAKKEWLGRQEAPQYGLLWCPYCIKWREFHYTAIDHKDWTGPELFRCTVCTISIRDYWVKKYNPDFFLRLEIQQQVKEDMRIKRTTVVATRRTRARRR